jgi:hypothetical protein
MMENIEPLNMPPFEDFVEEDDQAFVDLGKQETLQKGDVFTIARRETDSSFKSVLFIRDHLLEVQSKLDEFLCHKKKSSAYIQGPPGCGKTCFLYLWAQRLAKFTSKRVLIVQYRIRAPCFIWICEPGGLLWRNSLPTPTLLERVEDILDQMKKKGRPIDLCIHDGVIENDTRSSDMQSMLGAAVVHRTIGTEKDGQFVKGKVVHVTSLAFDLKHGHHDLTATGDIVQLSMESWRLDEFLDAVRCPQFLDQMEQTTVNHWKADKVYWLQNSFEEDDSIQQEDSQSIQPKEAQAIVKEKYYFAGGSARFMFLFSFEDLRSILDAQVEKVKGDDWKEFAGGSITARTPTSVNTLMQRFQGKCSPVSKYILWVAYDKCKGQLVEAVRATADATNNPALKGWAFELEQLEVIRSCLISQQGLAVAVKSGEGLLFQPKFQASFDGKTSEGLLQDSTVIWCTKWNQGCFDVAFYEKKTLLTLQFTTQQKHSLKLQFVRHLRQKLQENGMQCDKVFHIGIRDTDWDKLVFGSAEGIGRKHTSDNPEFEIQVCLSPPLAKYSLGADIDDFKCDPGKMKNQRYKMYKLTRKRRLSET